jgi:hypothetical protein
MRQGVAVVANRSPVQTIEWLQLARTVVTLELYGSTSELRRGVAFVCSGELITNRRSSTTGIPKRMLGSEDSGPQSVDSYGKITSPCSGAKAGKITVTTTGSTATGTETLTVALSLSGSAMQADEQYRVTERLTCGHQEVPVPAITTFPASASPRS